MTRESITVVALLILIGCLVPQCVSANDASVPLESWLERLKTLEGHKAAAFRVGPELVKLDPDFALKVMEAAWPELTDFQVKRGLLKAFHFGKSLRPKKHPRVLKILHLGMSDRDEKVRQYAAAYVKEYALEDFSGRPQAYAQWYEKHGDLPVEQVVPSDQLRQRSVVLKQHKNGRVNEEALKDVADIPSLDLTVNNNRRMRYFLIGAGKNAEAPPKGYNLVVIMPGGGGGANFHPFVRRIYKHALGKSFLVAQPVAFKWHKKQKIVWPTRIHPTIGQKFATEDFVEAVINDVKKRHKINDRNIFTLSWSSSGPAAYAISLQKNTAVRGSFVAMSVFRRNWLPPLDTAKGHIYYLLHSPQDKICPFSHAKQAKVDLTGVGALVRLETYKGGHGWRGNPYGNIRNGMTWLMKQTQSPRSSKY